MTGAAEHDALTAIAARGRITDEDVLTLRRSVFADGVAEKDEIAALFALNDVCAESSPAWRQFFIEAMVDFLVVRRPPEGFVAEEDAHIVMDLMNADRRVKSDTELEGLVKVLETARAAPDRLVKFALRQIKDAVTNYGEPGVPPRLDASRIALIRRVLHASGGDGGLAVTRAEAEALFDINDEVAGRADSDAWCDLFAKAIGNHLMAALGRAVPSREEALRLERWLETPSAGVGGFLTKLFTTKYSDVKHAYEDAETYWKDHNARVAHATAESERITLGEAEWLKARLHRDGEMSRAEAELLRFVKEISPDVAPVLHTLMAQAEAA